MRVEVIPSLNVPCDHGYHTRAGNVIADELVKELAARNTEPIRLVTRNPKVLPGAAEAISADLAILDDTVHGVSGSSIVLLVVGCSSIRLHERLPVYHVRKSRWAMTEETPSTTSSIRRSLRPRSVSSRPRTRKAYAEPAAYRAGASPALQPGALEV
jgi:hypothetical protein